LVVATLAFIFYNRKNKILEYQKVLGLFLFHGGWFLGLQPGHMLDKEILTMGVPIDSFADSTGTLDDILA